MVEDISDNSLILKRIVLKVGTSTLTGGTDRISRGKIEDIAAQISELRSEYEIILVTSGAIAAARQFSDIEQGSDVQVKQALAAIGQLQLMRIYQEIFRDYQLDMAQCLLTYYDFNNEESRRNIKGTIETLLRNRYIPIINENDTVAVDEIKFGDNDKLAALTASLLSVDVLILATDTDGVYTADPKNNPDAEIITTIHELSQVHQFISDSKSAQGSGGMKSKLQAAAIAQDNGVETWILNGGRKDFLTEALKNESTFTKVDKR